MKKDLEISSSSSNKVEPHSPTSPQLNYHRKRAIKLINELTKTEKSKKSEQLQYKVRTLYEINKEIEASMRRNSVLAEVFATDQLIIYIRYYFVQNITRCPCLTFFRLILVSEEVSRKYLSHNLPIYIARLVEREESARTKNINHEDQIYEALKLISEWANKFPQTFPKLLLSTVISFAELPVVEGFEEKKKDHVPIHLKLQAIDILIDLSTKSTKMFAFSGGFNVLCNSMLDPILSEKSENIVYRFIYFFNEKANREDASQYINLRQMFSIFTDLDNIFLEDASKTKGNMENSTRFEKQLELAKKAIIALMKSWTGIIYLGHEQKTLKSFLEAVKQIPKQQDSQVRKMIFSIVEEILAIGNNLICSESAYLQENEFRVSNLVNCYLVTLIQLLIDNGLFKILIELSGVEEANISDPSQRLLKKLSIYIFNFLPDCSEYIDFLISAATKTDSTSLILKSSTSFVMNKIGNYIYDQSESQIKNEELNELESLFSLNCMYVPLKKSNLNSIAKTLNTLTLREKENYKRDLINMNPIPKEHKENFRKWNWNVIEELFSYPDRREESKLDSHERHIEGKIMKYLLRFYSHTRGAFSELKWTAESFQYVKVGKLFIQNAITIPELLPLVKNPPESQFQCTVSMMGQLEKLLENTLISFTKVRNNFYVPFFKTMERQLLLWIGLFSENKVGYEVLLCENNFFQLLNEYIQREECALPIFSLMLYLDFYREDLTKRSHDASESPVDQSIVGPKQLLRNIIRKGSKPLKILSLEIIKLIFKSEMQSFPEEGIKMLLFLLSSGDEEIISEVIETIEGLLRQRENIIILIACLMEEKVKEGNKESEKKFAMLKSRLQRSKEILIRIVADDYGFGFINEEFPEWLEQEYEKWMNICSDNNYCLKLENLLNKTLNFVSKKDSEYKIENCKSIYELGFLYKLPWVLYLNEEQVPAHLKMTRNQLTLYYSFDSPNNYESLFDYQQKVLKVSLGIGNEFVNENLNRCKERVNREISLTNFKEVDLHGVKCLMVSEGGITVFLREKLSAVHVREQSQSQSVLFSGYEVKRVEIDIKIYFTQQNEQLPLHLIQEMTKTQTGMNFLHKKEFLSHADNVLEDKSSKPLLLRSVLWSLGYYGSTKLGINQLIEKGIVEKIIKMSFNCQVLSLRGTCRYILNMLCHSQAGRNFLMTQGFYVNKKNLNCFPKDIKSFYRIKGEQYRHFSLNESYWRKYDSLMKPMNEEQTKLFNSISQLINSLSYKQGIATIKQIMKSSIKVVYSLDLLQNVVNLLSHYKFRYEARKNIYLIFEEFFRSPDFHSSQQNKLTYVISADIQRVDPEKN